MRNNVYLCVSNQGIYDKLVDANKDNYAIAYYAGDDYGYCVLGATFYDIHNHIKSAFPDYKVIDFINSKRTGHFELHK